MSKPTGPRTTPRRRFPQEDARKRPSVDPAFARVMRAAARLGKYWDDLLGVLLIVGALLTVLALLGLTTGALTEAWVTVLEVSLGWGAGLGGLAPSAWPRWLGGGPARRR